MQHRQKTASELGSLANAVIEGKWDEKKDGTLKGLLDVTDGKENEIRKLLKNVKGIGEYCR